MQVSLVIVLFGAIILALLWLIICRAARKCLAALGVWDYNLRVAVVRKELALCILWSMTVVLGLGYGLAKLVYFIVQGW